MKRNNFLSKLKKGDKLELIEPSKDICDSYFEKSANCLKSAKLLLQNNLYENSISMSYYAMYDILISLLFKTGIKCENHSGSILLLKILFDEKNLFKLISDAKTERIDKQYYITTEKDEAVQDAQKLRDKAEDFIVKMKLFIGKLNNENIDRIRENFKILVG